MLISRCLGRQTRGFTLIELLVVIAIIALLIGILLPALGSARSSAVELACRVRMRELSLANFMYATDNRDRTMPASPVEVGRDEFGFARTANWAYTFEAGRRVDEGFLMDYVSEAVEIVACPLNQRTDPDGILEDPDDRGRTDIYPGGDLNFDYSFVAHAEGTETFAQFDVRQIIVNDNSRPTVLTGPFADAWLESDRLQPMTGLPLIVEESTHWYNNNSPGGVSDGLWGNFDQWTTRHRAGRNGKGGGGMTSYADGRVELFIPPSDYDNDNPSLSSGNSGFNSHDIYLYVGRTGLVRRLSGSTNRYGQINEFQR